MGKTNRQFFLLLIGLILFLFPLPLVQPSASAHLFGQPPFFKVNGKYANLYPVPLTSLYDFDLPQDLPPDNYLINKPISFELDKTRLPAPAEVIAKTRFVWDFGDQSRGEGLTNTHAYSRIGSYILKIYADDSTTPKPQLLESVLMNILPDPSYQLPKARILINGRESKDPLTDIISANLKDRFSLDGSKSTTGNRITSYFWDFGDQQSAQGPRQTHSYSPSLSQVFVILRIKDQNGFIADNYVEIQNSSGGSQPASSSAKPISKAPSKQNNDLPLVAAGVIGLILVLLMVRLFARGPGRGKH